MSITSVMMSRSSRVTSAEPVRSVYRRVVNLLHECGESIAVGEEQFVLEAYCVALPDKDLDESEKTKKHLFAAHGDCVFSLALSSIALTVETSAQWYQERRSEYSSNSFLAYLFSISGFESDCRVFELPFDAYVARATMFEGILGAVSRLVGTAVGEKLALKLLYTYVVGPLPNVGSSALEHGVRLVYGTVTNLECAYCFETFTTALEANTHVRSEELRPSRHRRYPCYTGSCAMQSSKVVRLKSDYKEHLRIKHISLWEKLSGPNSLESKVALRELLQRFVEQYDLNQRL